MNQRRYATLVLYEPEDNGSPDYLAVHPEIEGCFAQGETPAEAIENLVEVTELILMHLRESGLPIPAPNGLWDAAPQRLIWVEPDAAQPLKEFAPVGV